MNRDVENNVLFKGDRCTIEYAVRQNGNMPAKKDIDKLSWQEKIKLEVLLEKMAKMGKLSESRFKHFKGKIYEFKSGQYRALCFQDTKSWVLTNVFKKEKNKSPKTAGARAKEIMKEHLEK
ncbi:MAG: hypothetical protein FVQ80_10885 [Planctomycetes bacterium]|nr:hypothetical protein [Planctomycetota bacterium]